MCGKDIGKRGVKIIPWRKDQAAALGAAGFAAEALEPAAFGALAVAFLALARARPFFGAGGWLKAGAADDCPLEDAIEGPSAAEPQSSDTTPPDTHVGTATWARKNLLVFVVTV